MQEIQVCFFSSCWGHSELQGLHRSAETFISEMFSLYGTEALSFNGKRVKAYWAIERNNKSQWSNLLSF